MNRIDTTLLILLMCLPVTLFSQQKLNDYSFILIPQQFEFQRQQDEFRLNTYIRHLFNQNGFNAIYAVEMDGLTRCEGVFLELTENNSMFQTKLTIHIKDCQGNELYVSEEGASRAKDYETAYKEAFEKAFQEIPRLGVQQKDFKKPDKASEKPATALEIKTNILETNDMLLYKNNGKNYLLKKADKGWELYEVAGVENILTAKLIPINKANFYLFVKQGYNALASFDENGNLEVEGVDAEDNAIEQLYRLKN